MPVRIGQGIDIHPFANGRPLILGGVEISYEKGLAGHSDADALIHAICDALLGALALGDMGKYFPDTDLKWKGKSSRFFLEEVAKMVRKKGWNVANVDCTILTEEPKISPHVEAMRKNIANTLSVESRQISVKATRPERLGAFGRKEGLAVFAIALLEQQD